jgi:prolyl 4-hydroxylase
MMRDELKRPIVVLTPHGSIPMSVLGVVSLVFWIGVIFFVLQERSAWHGATNRHAIERQGSAARALFEKETADGHVIDVIISETISHNPRVKVMHDFLSAEECDQLIAEGGGKLAPSQVVGKNGVSEASTARSSSGTFLTHHTELIRRIEQRIARATMLPVENQEAFYLLRYEVGQEYKTHPDYFAKETDEAADVVDRMGGQRVATVLLYLNDVEGGGGTRFAKGGIEVTAKRGQALFWWDCHANGTVDPNSWHAGLPVEKGIKYAATKWIRERAFGTRSTPGKPKVIH